jgi:predicted O-methyltransferase YrrM
MDYGQRAQERVKEVLSRFDTSTPLVGAEIGVFAGVMSYCFVRLAPQLHLIMVDNWSQHNLAEGTSAEQAYQLALERTSVAASRTVILKMPSLEAARLVGLHSLDFAFIDADHSYEAVQSDIKAWCDKIKPGGWLCGHDYGKLDGVTLAVDEYASGQKLELGFDHTWFIQQ